MRIREAFEGLDAQTVSESIKEIADFKLDYDSRVETYNQFAQFLQDRLGGVFIFEYATDDDHNNWLSKYIQEVFVHKYNSTVWIFADIPAIEDLYKSDDKAGIEEFADDLADAVCREMEHRHIFKSLTEASRRSSKRLKERSWNDLQSDDDYKLTKDDIMEGVREQAYDYIYDDIENDNIRTEDEIYEFFKNYVHDEKEKGTAEGDVRIFELNVRPKLYFPHENYKEQHYAHEGPGPYDIDLYTLPEKYHSLIDDSY